MACYSQMLGPRGKIGRGAVSRLAAFVIAVVAVVIGDEEEGGNGDDDGAGCNGDVLPASLLGGGNAVTCGFSDWGAFIGYLFCVGGFGGDVVRS